MTSVDGVEIPEGCICHDKLNYDLFCPVCDAEELANQQQGNFGGEITTITDEYLSDKNQGVYTGFKFICPFCGVDSIMVSPGMQQVCLKCLRRFVVDSEHVRNFVQQKREERRSK